MEKQTVSGSSQAEVVVLLKEDYNRLLQAAACSKEVLERLEKHEEVLRRHNVLLQEDSEMIERLSEEVNSPRQMKAYIEMVRQDFKLNNYVPRSWKSIQIINGNGKPLSKTAKSFLKDALEMTGEFEFYSDSRDRRRLMIRYNGRKL